MTLPTLIARLRGPRPSDVVEVTLTGHPKAVLDMSLALASLATVTSMRHHVQGDDVIRLDATCHRPATRTTREGRQ